jgi:hypothetical protein
MSMTVTHFSTESRQSFQKKTLYASASLSVTKAHFAGKKETPFFPRRTLQGNKKRRFSYLPSLCYSRQAKGKVPAMDGIMFGADNLVR